MENARHSQIPQERMLINGQWIYSANERFLTVENPAQRDSVVAEVPRAGAQDVDAAVTAAARAFEDWRRVPARERGKLLSAIGEEVEAQVEELAQTVVMETGNAIRTLSRPEAKVTADLFRYFGGVAGELKGETVPFGEDQLCYTRLEPLGVVGGITPWNSPLGTAAVKIASALAAGNTVVLKPSSSAPLGVLKLARICDKHLPAGALNVLTGNADECGVPLAQHPLIRKLTFTGSVEGGKSVMRAAADRIVPSTMELGGKSPQIVFPDADEEGFAEGVVTATRITRQGQGCSSGSRIFIHESIFDSFLDKLARKFGSLVIGDPLHEDTDIGTIINRAQFDKVCDYIKDGMSQQGARLLIGGLPPTEGPLSQGYYATPTVFVDVRPDWRIAKEEIFGPVFVALPWRNEDEVTRMANESLYGLAGYVWTRDIERGVRTAHALDSGFIQVNQGGGPGVAHSYGGYKMSGVGREWSLEGMISSFTQKKVVVINLKSR